MLWRAEEGDAVVCQHYGRVEHRDFDHRPVCALLQDEGQVDCQVMRGEVSSRTKRYEPEWRYSLMLLRDLHTGAPTAEPAPHEASGMRHHDSLKLMTGIMAN